MLKKIEKVAKRVLSPLRPPRKRVRQADIKATRKIYREFFWTAFKALDYNVIDGDYVEFGCYGGMTFRLAFDEIRRRKIQRHLWAFDSFEGLPKASSALDDHPHWKKGAMAMGLDAFHRICRLHGIPKDGYTAVQVTTGSARQNRVNKPEAGHFAKASAPAGRGLWEFRGQVEDDLAVGAEIRVDMFAEGQRVDVRGVSKGKGFAGTIKRWNFAGQDATHGNSISHRAPGSIGQCQTPGRVFKGKKMSGHLGNVRVTTQNLVVVRVDTERNLLLVRGAVPGPAGGDVYIRPAVKA